jgi:hypothetical protein
LVQIFLDKIMINVGKSLVVLREIREYIIPLNEEEAAQLEQNILKEGCREPLIVWERQDGQLILVDGHNRFKICEKNGIPFKIKKVAFKDLDEVKMWMIDNQMGRRNLTGDQVCYYRGLRYLSQKKKKGGYDNVRLKGQGEQNTSVILAAQFNISESTIKRDARFAEGLEIISRSNPLLKTKILMGRVKVKKADIQILCNSSNADKIAIKNEADLHNKAKIIRAQLVDAVESRVKKLEKQKIEKAQATLKALDPPFLGKVEQTKILKGRIISAINRAIKENDILAIKELKKLVNSLEDILF